MLIDQFSSICCLPCRLKVVFLFLCLFPRLPCASCRGGGSLRSSLDRSWRCEAPSLLLGSFGPFSSLSFEAPSFAARLGGCAEAPPTAGGAERRCYKVRETQPMIYEERTFLKKRLGCFLFSLLARPFSRPSDLKSRSCSSEGFISAGAVCAASSYLAFSIIGGGFGRRLFPSSSSSSSSSLLT